MDYIDVLHAMQKMKGAESMGLIATQTGESYPPVEAGTHHAVCYSVVDLGTQWSEQFHQSSHKVAITWEFPELRIDVERDGEKLNLPRALTKIYTLSLSEKANLYNDLVAWRGKPFTQEELDGFNVLKVVTANCLLQVIHTQKDKKTYANIASVMHLMKDMRKKEPENIIVQYCIQDHGLSIPQTVPDWLVKIIHKSEEWKALTNDIPEPDPSITEEPEGPATGDDIPF